MKLFNFLQPKEATYLLETVDENRVTRNSSKIKLKGGFTKTKKVLAGLALVLTFGATLTSATLVSTAASDPAHAFIDDALRESFCVTQNKPLAPYGGSNEAVVRGLAPEGSLTIEENIINVSPGPQDDNGNPSGKWTALEEYGYFLPYYSNWNGGSPENNDTGFFAGTGGEGQSGYGSLILIENARSNPFFSSSPIPDCLGGLGGWNSGFANAIAWLPKVSVAITGEVYQWSFSTTLTNPDSPLYTVSQGIERVIVGDPSTGTRGLKDALFLDFLVPIIVIAAIGLMWTGIIKRSSIQAAQSALWMVGAAIAGIIFLTAPLQIVKIIDDTVVNVSSALADTALAGDNSSEFCELPQGSEDRAVRQIKCSVWYTTIYVPWVKGQFGVDQYRINQPEFQFMYEDPNEGGTGSSSSETPSGEGWANVDPSAPRTDGTRGVFANFEPTLGTEPAPDSAKNWAYYQMHAQANREAGEGLNFSEVAYNQIVINGNPIWKNADGAIGAAFLTVIGAIGPVAVIASVSFTIIAYQITMLILIALSPLFFLVGVAPGWGRRIAMRWLELMVGLLAKRIILTIFLLLFLRIYGIILQAQIEWFFQTILVLILAFAALTQRQRIVNIFTDSINFGGDKRLADDGSVVNAMRGAGMKTASAVNRFGGKAAKGVINTAPMRNVSRNVKGAVADRTSRIKAPLDGFRESAERRVGVNDNQRVEQALRSVNGPQDLRTGGLSRKQFQSLSTDGRLDPTKVENYSIGKMTEFSERNQRLTKLAEENRKKREQLREIADLQKRAREREKLRKDRDNLRKQQKTLNREVKTTFNVKVPKAEKETK